jgi:glycosyltransferase involved in cell wall biosynthesis
LKIVVSHPTGNANVRALVTDLLKAGMLEKFVTTIAYFENSRQLKKIFKDINRREFDESLRPFTETHSTREIGRHILNKIGLGHLTDKESNPFGITAVYTNLDYYLSKKIKAYPGIGAFYGYEDGSYYTFQAAKKASLQCIYELPIAYWQTMRSLLLEEGERLPEWRPTLKGGIADSPAKLERKTAELKMADLVITPSKFVAGSLPAWADDKKLVISSFGTPVNNAYQKKIPHNNADRPLRVLFVGSMSQRKGLADLFEAMKLLKTDKVELVVLGSLQSSLSFYKKLYPAFLYEAPRAHDEVLALMESCDVLCLPSIAEGRALVLQEAMSRGLPLIITPNTGGEDLVIEEQTGFLVPIRSPEAIAEKINWFLENRSCIAEMRNAAFQHAAKYTWGTYSKRIINAIQQNHQASEHK